MSGPLGSQQWMYSTGFYPHKIGQSLRFNDDDSAYLSRTPASTGNRKTWTWSGWVKRGNIGGLQTLFQCNGDVHYVGFVSLMFLNDTLRLYNKNSISSDNYITTSALYRDCSSWYHIVAVLDTANATASERAKLYVNGEQITSFSTAIYPPLDFEYDFNLSGNPHAIGIDAQGSTYNFDGYMAEVNFVDGQALDATSFGEFKSGVWIPKSYSGSYGTNGFYLDFGNSGSLGADSSGNGNNWTPTNLASTDQMLDSPTNNFATLNSIHVGTGLLYEGNLRHASAYGYGYVYGKSTIAIPETGKWVFEGYFLVTPTTNNYNSIGVTSNPNLAGSPFNVSGNYGINDASSTYGQSFVQNGTRQGSIALPNFTFIQVLVDRDNNEMTFVKDGVLQTGTGSTVAIPSSGLLFPVIGEYVSTQVINFGQDSSFGGEVTRQGNTDANGIGDFYYAPPAGYLALCTANLPDPAIDPAEDDVPADYFNTVLYTGNNSTQSITGVGFQPDWTWIKARNTSLMGHILTDAVRGVGKALISNATNAEDTNHEYGYLSVFDSDGFTVTAGSTNADRVNNSSYNYVSWNWLAGNGTSTNTDGTITSTVSANQKAGFSIVSYTGNGSNATVGHGLSSTPEMIIFKNRTSSGNSWVVYSYELGATKYLLLDSTGAAGTYNHFQNTAPTSSVAYITGGATAVNANTNNYIAYCFNSVEGYSKFGSYTGNGSTNGPFVYTGFQPAFVILKRTDAASRNWMMQNNKSNPYNVVASVLSSDLSDQEYTSTASGGYGVDFVSNGFKILNNNVNWNASGGTYIYMAFAEMPFKYANAR